MDRRRFLFLTGGTAGLLFAGGELVVLPRQMVLAIGGGCSFCQRHVSLLSTLAAMADRNMRVCPDCVGFFLGIGTSRVPVATDRAKLLVQHGEYDAAIRELLKQVMKTPEDLRTRLMLGDLFAKQNLLAEAVREYEFVAEAYAKEGFLLKALAITKQIAKMAGENAALHFRIGDLYERLGLFSDASRSFQIAFRLSSDQRTVEALAATHQIPVDWKAEEFWISLRHTMGARTPHSPDSCGFCEARPAQDDLFRVSTAAICRTCTTTASELLASARDRRLLS